MKKNTLVNLVLFTFFFGALSLNAQGTYNNGERDKIVFSNWLNPMDSQLVDLEQEMTIILFTEHQLHVYLKATIAPVETIADFPDIYIQYSFGSYQGTIGPLVDSDFSPITLSNGEAALQTNFPVTFQFTEECDNAGKLGLFYLPVSFSLRNINQNGNGLYPVLDYPQLFPMGWFQETDLPFPLPVFSETKIMDCYGLTTYTRSDDLKNSLSTLSQVSAQPNPFTDDIELTYQVQSPTKLGIKVFNALGQIFYEHTPLRKETGLHQTSIPLNHLPPGLYYLQLDTAENTQVKKIIKN